MANFIIRCIEPFKVIETRLWTDEQWTNHFTWTKDNAGYVYDYYSVSGIDAINYAKDIILLIS